MKKALVFSLFIASLAYANPYGKCIVCHGENGEKSALNGKSLIINEMSKADIKSALIGYKNGTYGGALKAMMKVQVMPLSNEDIEFIANKIGK
ncbi:c-type cytochrome [Arcobacter sp.]|uniref:c-type cytochrome n=1 Tax=Arcobacter sp. TaxID=1872629 RepID=UPI003C71AEAC